ncbi:MAG TPA: hypothetical protein VKI19_08425, partial [Acidimicrobiales bacterium]|nr:hypothetical protein [Acidimicrobiales bacterium]
MRRLRVAAALTAVSAALGTCVVGAVPAMAAGTSVTPGTVTPNPATAGSNSTYTVPFTATTAIPTAGTITLVGPAETDFSVSSASYSIVVDHSHSAAVASVAVSPSGGSPTNNQVQITLGTSNVAAGDLVTVTAAETTNPQGAGTTYQLQESTSTDTVPASSPDYAIMASTPASINVTQGDQQSAEVNHAFGTLLAAQVLDAYQNPVNGAQVTFDAPGPPTTSSPSGTFAACPDNVGGGSPTPANDCITHTNSSGVATASVFTANSHASATSTTYYPVTATVATGTGPQQATFHLANTATPVPQVSPGPVSATPSTEGSTVAVYKLHFETDDAIPDGSTILFTAPAGTTFPAPTCDPTGVVGCSPADYKVTFGASSGSDTANTVAVTGVTVTGGKSVSIQVGPALPPGTAIATKQFVEVTISGVGNPTVANPAYSIAESDGADTQAVASGTYPITPGPAATVTAVSGPGGPATVQTAFAQPLVALVE